MGNCFFVKFHDNNIKGKFCSKLAYKNIYLNEEKSCFVFKNQSFNSFNICFYRESIETFTG